jgi:hypothetical protein
MGQNHPMNQDLIKEIQTCKPQSQKKEVQFEEDTRSNFNDMDRLISIDSKLDRSDLNKSSKA